MQLLPSPPLSLCTDVVSACMACSIVVSQCVVCSVREQVFRLCPLVITDTARSGTRVEDNTVFVHPATAGVVVCTFNDQ